MRWSDKRSSLNHRIFTFRLLVAAASVTCIVYLVHLSDIEPMRRRIYNSNNNTVYAPVTADRPTSGDGCLRLFSLSESRMFWEKPTPYSPTSCYGSGLPPSQSAPCLTSLRGRRGRPTFIKFIGDSRARVIFTKLHDALEHVRKQPVVHDYFETAEEATFLENGQRVPCLHTFRNVFLNYTCYMEYTSDLVRATFHWTPFLSAGFADRLAVLEQDCLDGTVCPDLIVMTLGLWYAKKTVGCPFGQTGCVLLLRDELDGLLPVLQRLSQRIQIVYRVDGPHFQDSSGVKSPFNDALLAVTATITETLRHKVPLLHIWTASLAETIRFEHSVCRFLSAFQRPLRVKNRHECLDENHVGDTVRLSAAGAILRYLCRDVERHPAGHCCH